MGALCTSPWRFSRKTQTIWHGVNILLTTAAACMMISVCASWSINVSTAQNLAFMVTEYNAPVPGTNYNYAMCWYLGLEAACMTVCPENTLPLPSTGAITYQACQPVQTYATVLDQCNSPVPEGQTAMPASVCASMQTCRTSGKVSLGFAILAALFALCTAICTAMRMTPASDKLLVKKYSLISASLAFISCVAVYASFRPCGQDVENLVEDNIATLVNPSTNSTGTVSTRPGGSGVLCILCFSIFIYDVIVNSRLPVDPTVDPPCESKDTTAHVNTITENLLWK